MKMKWSSSSSSLSSAGDRRSSVFYTEHDTASNADEMTSNAFTSLESTILVPTIKSATLPSNPEKYLEFSKNSTKMTINSNPINNYKLKNITNKINNRQNNKYNNNSVINNSGTNNISNKTQNDDHLTSILNNLLYVEFRLKNDQKVIRQLLYEKDEIINRQWREILCIKAKYQDENIENIPIDEISQYCPKCRKNYYSADVKSVGSVQTIDDFGYRERKISPSQSVEFASSSEEPEFNQQHFKNNTFSNLRRRKNSMREKTTSTFTEYLKHRHHSYSPSPQNTPSISNSDDQIEVKSILSHNNDTESSYSQRINSLHGIKGASPLMTRSSGSSTTYELIGDNREIKQNNKFIYDFEDSNLKNDNKAGFEVTDDWYASASDVEDSDNGMAKPYGYNAVNPVLECVNQILLQQSMDGIIDNGATSPSPPPTNLPPEHSSDHQNKPPPLPLSLPPIPNSMQKNQTLPRVTTKRVTFSSQNSMVQVPRNKITPPPPPPPPPSSSSQSHNSNSSEKSMKNSSYDIQSIYSNEYEPIGGGSENTSVSSNYYIDMDNTSMIKPNSITNTDCKRNLDTQMSNKVKLNPPDLPPKPPNLIKVKKLTKFNLNLNQNLVNNTSSSGGNANTTAPNTIISSGGNSNVNGSVSEPDYCSISEIHEIIVNNNQGTKLNGNIQTVEAEVHKACDEYSISNNDDDSISVKSIIKLDDFNKTIMMNSGGNEKQTNDNSSNIININSNDHDDDSDDLNDIPKLPNVAEIITPTKKEAARNINNINNNHNSNNNSFLSINQDNYITKSMGELKFTNGNSTKLNGIINSATNKKLSSILLKSPTSNGNTINNSSNSINNKLNHQHGPTVIHDHNTISIIPTDKIPLIQAEFDWYNLDAEYGKSHQSGTNTNSVPDVLTNGTGTAQNHGVAQNSDLSFLKLFDNCNIEPNNCNIEYNLDDIEFNNNSNSNSNTHSSNSSTHSRSSSRASSGRLNQPDIIKKIQEFDALNGKTANYLKIKTNYEKFLSETTRPTGIAGKPIILPRRKRVYYSGPFV